MGFIGLGGGGFRAYRVYMVWEFRACRVYSVRGFGVYRVY